MPAIQTKQREDSEERFRAGGTDGLCYSEESGVPVKNDLQSNLLLKIEALVRWTTPDLFRYQVEALTRDCTGSWGGGGGVKET